MKSIAELIRNLRTDRDLKQSEIAAVLGISQQHYSLYENGVHDLPLRHFITLVDYYNVSADYFLGRCRLKDKTETDTLYITENYNASQLLEDILSLNPICRGIIVQHISYLKQIKDPYHK